MLYQQREQLMEVMQTSAVLNMSLTDELRHILLVTLQQAYQLLEDIL